MKISNRKELENAIVDVARLWRDNSNRQADEKLVAILNAIFPKPESKRLKALKEAKLDLEHWVGVPDLQRAVTIEAIDAAIKAEEEMP